MAVDLPAPFGPRIGEQLAGTDREVNASQRMDLVEVLVNAVERGDRVVTHGFVPVLPGPRPAVSAGR